MRSSNGPSILGKKESIDIWEIFKKKGCSTILDAGCGSGWFGSPGLRPPEIKVYGIDLDTERYCPNSRYEAVVKGDISSVPFKDSAFDGILARGVLEYVADDRIAVEEIYRVMGEDGVLIVEEATPEHSKKVGKPTYIRDYTKGELLNLLEEVNFSILDSFYKSRGIPGFGILRLDKLSYRLGKFLADLGIGRDYVVAKKKDELNR